MAEMKRLLGVDPLSGVRSYVVYDDNADTMHFLQEQDVDVVTDFNRQLYNEAERRHGEMERVASIPPVLWLELKQRGILDDPKKYRAWLNDPDNRAFRTRPGTV